MNGTQRNNRLQFLVLSMAALLMTSFFLDFNTVHAATGYTVAISINPVNGGTVTGAGVYPPNDTVTVNASPNSGWAFANWTENGQIVSTSVTYTFTLTSDCTLIANFIETDAAVFVPGPSMNVARMGHSAVTLSDGRVALFGGHGEGFVSLSSSEIWSPSTSAFSTLQMNYTHDSSAFVSLADGTYLLAGGSADWGVPAYATSETFTPNGNTFTKVGNMVRFRAGTCGTTMKDGNVLIASAWWTHNDANLYGELYNTTTQSFAATGAFNVARADAIVWPTSDGQAVVLGGYTPTGGLVDQPVELFDPATGSITTLQTTLFKDETGWMTLYDFFRPSSAQRLANGRYIGLAWRQGSSVTSYRLFTFDPQTKTIAVMTTDPALPDSSTASLLQPVVDRVSSRIHLVAQLSGSTFSNVAVYSVELTSGKLIRSKNSYSTTYHIYSAGIVPLADGRLMITGGTSDGSNFHPVSQTLLITPPASRSGLIFQPGPGLNDGTDDGSINAGKDAVFYDCAGSWSGTGTTIAGSARSTCNQCSPKAYIQFNISTLPSNVDRVYLGVTHLPHTAYCYSMCAANFYFYPVLTDWNEMALPSTPPEEGSPVFGPLNITFPNDFGSKEYDITEIYKKWKNGTVANHGLAVYSPDQGCNNAAVTWNIYSSDSADAANRPYLKVVVSQPVIKGDINGDGQVNLTDSILCLQILCGLTPGNINPASDVNGDGKIGLEDGIYVLQVLSGVR